MSYWQKEMHHQQAFRYDVLSEECRNDIRLIQDNNADTDEFLLNTTDAEEFTDLAWKLLGQYIANNMYLSTVDLDRCRITDEKMTLLFRELVRSSSLKVLHLSDNEFGTVGVQKMIPFLQNCPNLSRLYLKDNENFNSECFGVLVSELDETSVEELYFYSCNITDISAFDRNDLPNLQILNLGSNNIGREGCITISNLLQKEGSKLNHLYLDDTGIDDEGTEILVAALKHNTKLRTLELEENNNIKERGCKAILTALVDVSSIENSYDSNNTLSACYLSGNTSIRRLKSLINSACNENGRSSNPDGIGRAKVIRYHLNSQTLKELCYLQGIEYSAGSIFADIESILLPKVLALTCYLISIVKLSSIKKWKWLRLAVLLLSKSLQHLNVKWLILLIRRRT